MANNKLVELPYVIFYVKSVPDLLVFYQQAFNLSPSFVHESGHFAELISGGVTLAFRSEAMATSSLPQKFQKNHLNALPQAFEISFHTQDVSAVYKRAIHAGAMDIAPPHVSHGVKKQQTYAILQEFSLRLQNIRRMRKRKIFQSVYHGDV